MSDKMAWTATMVGGGGVAMAIFPPEENSILHGAYRRRIA